MKKTKVKLLSTYVKQGRFYESVVEDGSDIIFVMDHDTNILYHNSSVKVTLGYGNKVLVGRNFFEFIHPSELDEIKEKIKLCKTKPYCQGVEFRFLCKDSSYRFLEFNSINLKQKEGLKGLIMDCRDITQRKKDAEELLRAQKARELFLANISHEIRTPINGISGMATLLNNNPSSEDSKTYLNAIKSASENLKAIINDILDLSSIESGKLKFERIGFKIQDLVASLMGSFKSQASAKHLGLTYSIHDNAKEVFLGDPVRLNQILINLIGNALKFTHQGSITLSVSVIKRAKMKSLVQFDVTDTGIGVPKEKLETIFESFSQADASVTRKYGGTGLGLTIVKQLVEMQKGWIKVSSEVDEGSTFTFAIPYAHGGSDATHIGSSGITKHTNEIVDLSGYTILLVEDNDINRLYAGSILKTCGCNIEMAENGLVAISKLKSNQVDLVLMNIQMPVMDGFEATKAIRAESALEGLPVIALTANATDKVIEKCLSSGMNGYLGKPFTPDELFSTLTKYLTQAPRKSLTVSPPTHTSKSFAHANLSFLERVSGNNPEFMREVVTSFVKVTPALLAAIKMALAEGDSGKISLLIHRIKPSLTMMGVIKTKELADYLEVELGNQELNDYMRQGLNKFCEEVSLAIDELMEY